MAARKKPATASPKTPSRRRSSFQDTGHKRNYCQIAFDYASEVAADRKGRLYGSWTRKAARRFLDDLKRAGGRRPAFRFDPWHANNACDFIEELPHVEGRWDTPNIVLHRSHVFFVVQLFGFRSLDGNRRFSSALFAVARKNAKSTLAAGILLYCLCCEDEPGAQVLSAATTFGQASIIFKIAKMMAEKTPDLRSYFGLECFAKAVAKFDAGSSMKAIHAKASTQDGLNPSHTALDEIHAHKTADLLNVLTSAAGARKNPLWLYTTTEGYASPGPWGELRQFARQLLDGVFGTTADHFLALIYAVDDDDEEFAEDSWRKANPLMEVNPELLKSIRKEAVEAKAMPSKLAEFKIKRLNRQAETAGGFIDLNRWKKCGGAVDLDWLAQFPCTAALDLAATTDLCSWRLVWKVEGKYYTWGRRWVPEGAVIQRTIRGTVPYAGWVAQGLVEQTEGDVTDYAVVEQAIREDFARFKIEKIAYDRWNALELVNRLGEDEFPLIEFIQGTKSFHPAMKELEAAYISGNLAHGDDPVLFWQAANLVARRDVNMNMAPDKKRSPDKIDDMATLLMGIGVGLTAEAEKPPEYQFFFV